MFANPYGTQMPRAWLTIMQLSLPDVIQEHARLDFTRPEAWMVLLLGATYVWALWRSRSWRVAWLLPLVWLLLACDRVRHAPLFAVMAAIGLAEILPRPESSPASPAHKPHQQALWLPAGIVLLALLLQASGLRVPVVGANWASLERRLWPIELLPHLRQLEQEHPGAKIFNSLHYGGLLAFYTPGLRTFIDDRCELFGDAFLREYAHAERSQPQQIDAWQRQFGFKHALVQAQTPFDRYLSGHASWQLVERSPTAALYRWAE
jgi:hypothetical protein